MLGINLQSLYSYRPGEVEKAKALLNFFDNTSRQKLNRAQAFQVQRSITPLGLLES